MRSYSLFFTSLVFTGIADLKVASGADVTGVNSSECEDEVGWKPYPSFPGCNDDSTLCDAEDQAVMQNCCKCRCTSSPEANQNNTSCYTPPFVPKPTVSPTTSPPFAQDNPIYLPTPTPPPTNYYQNWKENGGAENGTPFDRFFFGFFVLFFFMTILLKGNQIRAHRRNRRYLAARAQRLRRAVMMQEQTASSMMPSMPDGGDDAARYERIISKFYFQVVLPDQSNVNPESLKPDDVERPSSPPPPNKKESDNPEGKKTKDQTTSETNEAVPSDRSIIDKRHREEAVEEITKPSSASSIVQNNKTSNHHPSLCEVISSWASVGSTSPPSDVCCICLEGYSVGDTICVAKKPTCDHLFHKDCVLEWMKTNDECPLCRINLLQ